MLLKGCIYKLAVALLLISLLAGPASAAPTYDPNSLMNDGIGTNIIKNSEGDDVSELAKLTTGGTVHQFGIRPSLPSDRPAADEGAEPLPVESEEQEAEIVHRLPLQGHQMIVNSEAMREMIDQGLDGVVTLFKITSQQTEPAEAAGAQGAEITAALLQNNIMASERLFLAQYMTDPQTFQHAFRAYSRCVYDGTKANQETGSWLAATSECLGDTVAEGTQGPESFLEADSDNIYDTQHDPVNEDEDIADPENVLVTDWLFNKAIEAATGDEKADLQDKKQAWLELFGDMEIVFETEVNEGPFAPIRESKVRRIRSTRYGDGATTQTIAEFTTDRVDERFRKLREVLYKYCEASKEGTGLVEWVDRFSVPSALLGDKKEYWSDSSKFNDEDRALLSMPGMPIQSSVLNAFYHTYVYRYEDSDGTIDCTPLDPDSVSAGELSDIDGEYAKYLDFSAVLKRYATYVAHGQVIHAMVQAQQFVNFRSNQFGESNPGAKEFAMKLIYEAANTTDLIGLAEQNIVQMAILIEGIAKLRAQETGDSAGIANTAKTRVEKES